MSIENLARKVMKTGQTAFMEGDELSHCNLADVYAFFSDHSFFNESGQKWKRFFAAVERQIMAVDQQFDNGVMQYARPLNETEKVIAVKLARSYKG